MPFTFTLPAPTKSISGAANPNNVTEESLKAVGFEFASNALPDEYMFSRMGGWNVTVRASVIRIVFMKLLGTGLAAAFMATSPHVGSFTAWSLTMAAAVNIVACAHYWRIWALRNQSYLGPKYDKWMANVGRAPTEDRALVAAEKEHDQRAVYFQEVAVDGLRFSDWLCTLVLLSLDLGHLRTYLFYATSGVIPDMPIAKEWVASMQAAMILFASVWRFYCNEGRSVLQPDGSHKPPALLTIVLAWGSFVVSSILFYFIVWALLDGLPSVSDAFPSHINADITCMRVLTLSWCGYPVVALASRLGHWGLPGDYFSASWSTFKDIGYAFLDVTAKAGLAIYFVLKASWVSGATEDALVAAGKAALNVTV